MARHRPALKRWLSFCMVALLAAAVACSDASTRPATGNTSARRPVDLSAQWVLTPPTAEDVDSAQLRAAMQQAARVDGLASLLVVRHGHLIAERYFGRETRDSLHSVRSDTKSVISLLVGIALQRGILHSTSQTLSEFFHPPLPVPDSAEGAITIQDLLTMSGGFRWKEETDVSEFSNWVTARDQIAYLFARPLVSPPGKEFNYNSAAVHLLSVILNETAPGGTNVFADSVLFAPLGIHIHAWAFDSRGIPNGGAGLWLRPRDMAKIGQLVLQNGMSGDSTVVAPSWIHESTSRQITTREGLGTLGSVQYGDLWWLGSAAGHDVIYAWGYGGQYIVIVPDLDLVVVTTAAWQGLGQANHPHEQGIMDLIVSGVIPAVH
ncbi:MAG TPA: serine hydrolase [Gemmatimonadaceae bacterium]|nr:serine hydrolase [Gemmatimonadaceae bacterium]